MDDQTGWVVVFLMIVTIGLCLMRDVYVTWNLRKSKGTISRRTWIGHQLMCISLFGLLISYVMNVLVRMQAVDSTLLGNNSTNLGCFFFLAIYFIAKFGVIKRGQHQTMV